MALSPTRAVAVGAASLIVCVLLSGCGEDPYHRALRVSCHWNVDIALKGCDRLGFKHCVDDCEYCVGSVGSVLEGKGDDCAQLKCGAYCAKRHGDECLSTYSQLCSDGLGVLMQQGLPCDANCNAAAPRSPRLLGLPPWLLPGLLAAAQLPAGGLQFRWGTAARGTALAAALGAAALHLQGCADCAPAVPTLNWMADLEHMDRLAGCKNDWGIVWGSPCASDVPVPLAKKGFVEQTDGDFRRARVENEVYECTLRGPGGYCAQWTTAESSCDEEDFGMCACKETGPDGRYCRKWQCISKEASQNVCWKACCGDTCDPCVECGAHGTSPFPMSEAVFRGLVASDSTAPLILSGAGFVSSLGAGPSNATDGTVLTTLRRSYWHQFFFNGECIMPRDVKNYHESPCSTWREVETEISSCECTEEGWEGRYCQKWKCEEKDVGMFSILFSQPKSYANLLSGHEEEVYTCLQTKVSSGMERCIKWSGDISGYEEVEATQCMATCQASEGDWCDKWACNEYELPRVQDVDQWGKRLGFCVLHSLWLVLPGMILAGIFAKNLEGPTAAMEVAACLCLTLIQWAIGFVRHARQEGRWIRPVVPLLSMLLTLFLPFAAGTAAALLLRRRYDSGFVLMLPFVSASLTFVICSNLWATGLMGIAVFVPILLCIYGAMYLSARASK